MTGSTQADMLRIQEAYRGPGHMKTGRLRYKDWTGLYDITDKGHYSITAKAIGERSKLDSQLERSDYDGCGYADLARVFPGQYLEAGQNQLMRSRLSDLIHIWR